MPSLANTVSIFLGPVGLPGQYTRAANRELDDPDGFLGPRLGHLVTEGNFRAEVELGESNTPLALVGGFMGSERLPLAVLEHQHPVVALAEIVGELRAVAPADHVRLPGTDESPDGLVGGVGRCGTGHCEQGSQ